MPLNALHELPAPAKLNLFLHINGRRADGYHLLQSVFVLIDWADTLHLELRRDGQIHRHDLGPALPQNDLCLRAAQALQRASGCTYGVDISILKEVPWGAGLGGGSSDAATVLLGLNRLWDLGWSRAQLLTLGATLGADVPFFIGGQNALVEGIGEQLRPLVLPPMRFAVVKPAVALSTAEIFSSPLVTRDTSAAIVAGLLAENSSDAKPVIWSGAAETEFWGHNDLQPAAEALSPEVTEAVQWLKSRFGNSRMTGSGSAVFAGMSQAIDSGGEDDRSLAIMKEGSLPSGWIGRISHSLPNHPLVAWAD